MKQEQAVGHQSAFGQTCEPAYIMDPEHDRILAANEAGCALLGYPSDELLRTPISQIHPCDLPQLAELLDRVLSHGNASTITLTCRTKQGNFLPTEIALYAILVDGRLRILGLVQDRSEHRHIGVD